MNLFWSIVGGVSLIGFGLLSIVNGVPILDGGAWVAGGGSVLYLCFRFRNNWE